MQNNRVRALREKLGLTRPQFSKLVGMSVYSVSSWEKGRHIPAKHYDVLSKVFKLPIEDIVWEVPTDHREIEYIEDPSNFEPGKDVRPQVECFCGNCDFWKEGMELLLKCSCKSAEKYGEITGRNYLCTHWQCKGLSYTDVLTVLPDDGVLWKNLTAARLLNGLSTEQVAAGLGIDEAVWKQYEKGVKAMPLEQLARFSELCGISADKLVKRG